MKKITLLLTLSFSLLNFVNAQTPPNAFNYSAVARNAAGQPIATSTIGIQVTILKTSPTGASQYSENHFVNTDAYGLFNLVIGAGAVQSGSMGTIDWSNDNYYLKVGMDAAGGTNFLTMGTTQLLSVPYALYAKSAGSVSGGSNFSGDYNDLTNTPANVSTFNNDAGYLTQNQQLSVSTTGDTLHLQNGGFVIIPGISVANTSGGGGVGTYPPGTVHCLATPTAVVDVTNPVTGKTWMDRNLGASQVAISSTDANAYGDLYQWGRGTDGHQCRNSATTGALSSTDQPGHGYFIIVSGDWRSPQNDNLWQGVNGVNNPCPSGYRLPTETEINAERLSWSANTSVGAFASPLKLPMAGLRDDSNGSLNGVGTYGGYWSSTVSGAVSRRLGFVSSDADMSGLNRALGLTVRCLKD